MLTSLLTGAIAGGIAKTCIAPLDKAKIYFQVNDQRFSVKNVVKFVITTTKQNGISSLWRGNSASMIRIVPYAAIQFCSHEQLKKLLQTNTNEKKSFHNGRVFLAGCFSGIISTSMTYPLDLVRAKMAVMQGDKVKLAQVFTSLIKQDGYLALYRGFIPSLIGIVPYAGVTFYTYETAKRMDREYFERDKPIHTVRVIYGALAGLVGQSVSYPFDVIRRRMQCSEKKVKMLQVIRGISSSPHPIRNFYKGVTLNWIKGPISIGLSLSTFDLLKSLGH